MKFSRVKNLSLGIALAVVVADIPLNASADMLWPEAPDVSLYSSTNTFNEQDAGQPQPIEIEYGSPVSGTLGDDNDFIGSDGVTHFDRYHFVVQETSKPYVITLLSPEFSAASTLVYVDEAQQKLLPLQSAFVWAPNGQVQYSGQLTTSGNYFIDVLANDGNNGTYTITLGDNQPPVEGDMWVHVSHMGNAVWTILGVPTAHMQLVDASGNRLVIPPWGCITLGGEPKNYWYSAWAIDQVSTTPPTQETICYDSPVGRDCIPAWYPVDLPVGFQPVQYNAGCELHDRPFDFQ
jgi:hypothetical protein